MDDVTCLKNASLLAAAVCELSNDGIVFLDSNGMIRFANQSLACVTGIRTEKMIGQHISSLLPDQQCFARPVWKEVLEQGGWQGIVHYKKYGYPRCVKVSLRAVKNKQRSVINYVGFFVNQHESKEAEDLIHMTSAIFDNTVEGIMITDRRGTIQKVNPAFATITGYMPEDVVGKKPSILSSGQHDAQFYVNMWTSIHEKGQWQGEIWNRRKNGEIYLEWLTISVIREKTGVIKGYAGIFTDITERKNYEEKLVHQSSHDSLTGLPNRLLFQKRLASAILQAKANSTLAAVVIIDIDRFKSINDSLGPSVGDQLLQEFAVLLKNCVGDKDTVSRIGGDEFAVLFTSVYNKNDIVKKIQSIVQSFDLPVFFQEKEFYLTGSVGISLYPFDGDDAETLLKNADAAMYHAKNIGGNTVRFFTADMNEAASKSLMLDNYLRKALEREEFVLYYQPKINLSSNRIVGVEALIRWNQPELGLVSPLDFIPFAEETGLILSIGEWVLRTACHQNKLWQLKGLPPMKVAVNLSGRQFQLKNLATRIANILEETGLDPEYLELEIT